MNKIEFVDQIEVKKLEKTTLMRFGQKLGKKISWVSQIVVPDGLLKNWDMIIQQILANEEK